MNRIEQIDAEIKQLVQSNRDRMNDALKDPQYNGSVEKLTLFMLDYQQTLLQLQALQQERLVLLLEHHLRS